MAQSYGETVNTALLRFMGSLRGTVLDLGCGVGEWADLLRVLGANQLLGIEPSGDAQVASPHYDHVYCERLETIDDLPPLDVVIAADVLEHLIDPWEALGILRRATTLGGTLFVSVPNIQFVKGVATILGGHFPYEDGGFWDRTHLHWFTRHSLEHSLLMTGWAPRSVGFVLGGGNRRRLNRATLGALEPFLGHQLHVRAEAV